MKKSILASLAAAGLLAAGAASAQTTLRIHQMLPSKAIIPAKAIKGWAEKVSKESGGKIRFQQFDSMQLGGKPPQLFDQAKDGVVDIIWTVVGYTPGRFPCTEAFELPFIATNGEQTSMAFQEFADKHCGEQFKDVKVIAMHTHGPGLLHTRNKPVEKLEDLQGMKLRGTSRVINDLLGKLGATPVGMPVPAVPESLSKGVIDGTVIPWEVTVPLKISELAPHHTTFSGRKALYTATFAFVMNKARYEALPADLKKVIDDNSGMETAAMFGRVMDEGDAFGLGIAQKTAGNTITTLDATEVERWREAARPVIDSWIDDMKGKGMDGAAMYQDALRLVEKYAK